jgi:plasmid maintenance system antidote protein VapI
MRCPRPLITGGNGFDPTILCFALCVELVRYFSGTTQFWLNLQFIYDLRTAEGSAETKRALREIEPLERSAA